MSMQKRNVRRRGRGRGKGDSEPKPTKQRLTLPRGLGFPDTARVSLTYTDTFAISSLAFQTMYQFRGNSCYDPDLTSIGHQPAYFDTYSEVYSKYKVYGSTIDVRFANATVNLLLVAIVPHSTNLSLGTASYVILDLPRARWSVVGSTNIETNRISHKASTSEIIGLTSRQIEDDDYSALISANPNQVWYWNLYLAHVDPSKLNVSASLIVRITYDVKFYDKTFTPPSLKSDKQTPVPACESVPQAVRRH